MKDLFCCYYRMRHLTPPPGVFTTGSNHKRQQAFFPL
jgi:hypothetical protein